MFNYSNKNCDCGFTLIELMVAALIVGVLAAIASPNLSGWINRYRVKLALIRLEGAIKEAQRQAMLRGNICRVNISPDSNLIFGNPAKCLLNNRKIKDEINIRTNLSGTPPNISFSHKGSTTKMGTIVVSSDATDLQHCFVIALGTGISRTGTYIGNKSGSISSTKCTVKK